MTTPGDNGARTPEEEDPFGYLYADGQAAGAAPPPGGGGYGYPGRSSSHHQVRPVGERQYGQQQTAAQGYGQQGGPQAYGQQGGAPAYGRQAPQPGYDQAHYSAPETFPAGEATRAIPAQQSYGAGSGQGGHGGPGGGHGGGGRGRGPNTKGLLIGAVAVVAAVVVGISIAMLGGEEKDPQAGTGTDAESSAPASQKPSPTPESKEEEQVELPKTDAKVLQLTPPAATASDVKGAKAGSYVGGFNQVGASLTWQIDGFEKPGTYRLYVSYSVPGEDTTGTLSVNGDKQTRPLNMANFAKAKPGDWEKGWTHTYAVIQLNKGTNIVKLSCEQSDKCNANIDQMWLAPDED